MQPYQPHKITRSRVIVGLMITAMLASCAAPAANRGSTPAGTVGENRPTPPSPPPVTPAPTQANVTAGEAKAVQEEIRFTDVASCKAETERLNAEYKTRQAEFDAGTLTGAAPIQPTLKPEDCDEFIASAQQKYAAQAPTYATQGSCEASGQSCERVTPSPNNNYVETVYRPVFFGSYGYNPWVPPVYIGGRRDYGQQTVIIERDRATSANSSSSSSSPVGSPASGGNVSSGSASSTPSRTTPSKATSTTAKPGSSKTTPSKPAATSGSKAITGRGSSGFGSSYGYSGRGGK